MGAAPCAEAADRHFALCSNGLEQLAGALREQVKVAVWKHAEATPPELPDKCVHQSVNPPSKPLLHALSAACWQPLLLLSR